MFGQAVYFDFFRRNRETKRIILFKIHVVFLEQPFAVDHGAGGVEERIAVLGPDLTYVFAEYLFPHFFHAGVVAGIEQFLVGTGMKYVQRFHDIGHGIVPL